MKEIIFKEKKKSHWFRSVINKRWRLQRLPFLLGCLSEQSRVLWCGSPEVHLVLFMICHWLGEGEEDRYLLIYLNLPLMGQPRWVGRIPIFVMAFDPQWLSPLCWQLQRPLLWRRQKKKPVRLFSFYMRHRERMITIIAIVIIVHLWAPKWEIKKNPPFCLFPSFHFTISS